MSNLKRNPFRQHTLASPLHFVGRGLHTGVHVSISLMPAIADSGYVFERLDVDERCSEVPARWYTVTNTRLCTTVSNSFGVSVSTVEHLIAALSTCGVDNCRIIIDGPEVPILDGSAETFVNSIQHTGLKQMTSERRAVVITKPIWSYAGERCAGFVPFPKPWIDMTIDFDTKPIGKQSYSMPIDQNWFMDICKARAFGFEDQIEVQRSMGLGLGGTLQNSVLISDKGVVNKEGLHYQDEFVRHKILDAIGDIGLINSIVFGRFIGFKSGHSLNNRLIREVCHRIDTVKFTTVKDATENWSELIGENSYDELLSSLSV